MEMLDALVKEHNVRCPECGGELTESQPFNLMFRVYIGPLGKGIVGYGRPEAAQGQFVDFKRVYAAERERLPLGIAQIGRAMRNEIAPRKGPIRLREFTIIDYEVFVDPEDMSYPRIKKVEDVKLRILPAEEQLAGTNRVYEVTVREALEKGFIKNEVHAYFLALSTIFMQQLGIPLDKQRFREQLPEERAHYSMQTFDQEVLVERWGWVEVAGHSYRYDYDLSRHMERSGADLTVYKAYEKPRVERRKVVKLDKARIGREFRSKAPEIFKALESADPGVVERELAERGVVEVAGCLLTPEHVSVVEEELVEHGRRFVPHVVEPSFGLDRLCYVALEYAYSERDGRVVLRLPKDIAPVQVAVFPLLERESPMREKAFAVYRMLVDEGFDAAYDDSGSIGKRYARADEIGVPLCITVDYRTLEDDTVTIRDRDTWRQVRNEIDKLPELLRDYFRGRKSFEELGEPVG